MLAALLPGIRDLRTPLATGYAWMLALWLVVGKEKLQEHRDNVVIERVADLVGLWGSAAMLAAFSFLAYLTGSLLVVGAFGRIFWGVSRLLRSKGVVWALGLLGVRATSGVDQSNVLVDWSESASRRIRTSGIVIPELMSDSHDLPPAFVRRMKMVAAAPDAEHQSAKDIDTGKLLSTALREYVMAEEFESLAIRLQIERELIYDAYDRLSTEAELRFSISPPIVAAFASAGLLWSPWWFLGLAFPSILLFQGAVLAERARARVVQALASNVIESPVVAALLARGALPQYAQEAIEQRESQAAEACFAALAGLEEAIPRYASIRRSAEADPEDEAIVRAEHEKLLGQLEANIVLLGTQYRTEMEGLLAVLRYAYDLSADAHRGTGWHPDGTSQIAKRCAAHGRDILAAQLRRQPVPDVPSVVHEYVLANQDRNDGLGNDFASEIGEHDQVIAEWRGLHGLPPTR